MVNRGSRGKKRNKICIPKSFRTAAAPSCILGPLRFYLSVRASFVQDARPASNSSAYDVMTVLDIPWTKEGRSTSVADLASASRNLLCVPVACLLCTDYGARIKASVILVFLSLLVFSLWLLMWEFLIEGGNWLDAVRVININGKRLSLYAGSRVISKESLVFTISEVFVSSITLWLVRHSMSSNVLWIISLP